MSIWTDAMRGQLREYVDKGYSCAGCARRMKLTRGQVAGQAYHLGLRFRNQPARGGRGRRMNWTPEEVFRLAELRRQGLAFSAIARDLGKTRNACIARADRDGLKQLAACRVVNRSAYEIGKRLKGKHVRPRPTKLKPPKLSPVALPAGALPPLNIDVMGLKPGMCRWPVSEERPHKFCGHPRDGEHSAYCPFHQKLSVRPEPPASMEKFAAWISRREYRVNTGQREAA